jgi:hypothetical protein
MQAYAKSVKCKMCDVPLAGREQFVGHMIHGHDMSVEQAAAMWESIQAAKSARQVLLS